MQVAIQVEAAKQRLGAAARVQAGLARDGWRIFRSEMDVEARVGAVTISGRIDRVDRHTETGRLRILDEGEPAGCLARS